MKNSNLGTVTYFHITGKVGETKVDLKVGIPIGEIIDQTPALLDMIVAKFPKLNHSIEQFVKTITALGAND